MTLSEFKAWFEGFTETMDGPPNSKQWARIQKRIAEIDGEPVPQRVIERHYHDYHRWWPSRTAPSRPWYGPYEVTCGTMLFSAGGVQQSTGGVQPTSDALADMGRADAAMVAS